jgi:hypothetical protein
VHDDGSSALSYLFANRFDSYEWTTYPVREDTLYCAFASKFAAPFTCPWELPGCSEPRYPARRFSARAWFFGAWGMLVKLSYFHWVPVFSTGVIIHTVVLVWLYLNCCRGRPSAASPKRSKTESPSDVQTTLL